MRLPGAPFEHAAVFYDGSESFVAACAPFVEEGIAAGEPTLVATSPERIELLAQALGAAGDEVMFVDIEELGCNPARIIPSWRAFFDEFASDGRSVRGIGEPIWSTRTSAELVECERHEYLLNLAFSEATSPFKLLCPYDTSGLPEKVIDNARRNHPLIADGRRWRKSVSYRGLEHARAPFDQRLPEPEHPPVELDVRPETLWDIRRYIGGFATGLGMDPQRADDLALAANELATNSLRHGGGAGVVRIWHDLDSVIVEVRDAGYIVEPMVGRTFPAAGSNGGRGLWLVNQLCDLLQLRSSPRGTVARVTMRL